MARLTKKQKRAKAKKQLRKNNTQRKQRWSKDSHKSAYQLAKTFAPLIALNLITDGIKDEYGP